MKTYIVTAFKLNEKGATISILKYIVLAKSFSEVETKFYDYISDSCKLVGIEETRDFEAVIT